MMIRVNFGRRPGLVILAAILSLAARPSRAQVAPGDFFKEPVLILAGGGHHAPVRSLLFTTANGTQLLSGGMDKVIHVWNLDADLTRPARTLRPPNWRGFRGQVNAMALSPVADAAGQRLLAVAGYGVLADQGEILLFRFPDPTGLGTGEIVGQLAATTPDNGHQKVVTSLAFTGDGRFLASGSNDRTVRIWDVAGRRTVAVLNQSTDAVNSLAIFEQGTPQARATRLVTGGRDGWLRLYDITDPTRPGIFPPVPPTPTNPQDPFSATIVSLSASRDGRTILVGTEGGLLVRRDARTLAGTILPNVPTPGALSGPVEAVAISPDNTRFAVSVVERNLARAADSPTVSCVVEVRRLADGAVEQRVATPRDLVMALAFSPDGRRLAFSGGEAQSVFVKDLGPNAPALVEIPGQGSNFWDVGFRADGQAIRFARVRPNAPGTAADYEAFDLRRRFLYDPEPGEPAYRHALASDAGWTIRPLTVNQLAFDGPGGLTRSVTLDPNNERRWFCYTVIKPDPAAGHPDPVAAVGCGTGVAFWNLSTGNRTRFFTGHAGPVYALASSADGKWLVTGSSDQTARLWPLMGCDRIPPFGARFAPLPGGGWTVTEVTPGGFAEGIKLRKGHVIEKFFVGADEQDPANTARTLPDLDNQPATVFHAFHARIGAEPLLTVGTTKRDSPSLTLFPAANREWVFWTPKGHYDTSAAGDRKYLGWLTNRGQPNGLLAGRFDTIDKFEARFRQPKAPAVNAIDRMLDTGDLLQSVAAAPPVAPAVASPETSGLVRDAIVPVGVAAAASVLGRPVTVQAPQLTLRYDIAADAQAAAIAQASIVVEGRVVANLINGAAVAAVAGQVVVPLPPSQILEVALVTTDVLGVIRTNPITVSNQAPPQPTRRPSRLEILAIGPAEFADSRLPSIRYAQRDAVDLSTFFQNRLVDPANGHRFANGQVHVQILDEPREVAIGPLTDALDDLRKQAKDGRLGPGDVVAVVIESHFFSARSQQLIATSELEPGPIPAAVSASELADRLGELARLGCRVFTLVDAVHEVGIPDWDNDLKEWIRQLQSRNKVALFVAAGHGPSSPRKDQSWKPGHRAFADGILTVLDPRTAGRLRTPGETLSIADFQQTLIDTVLNQTRRKQHVGVYLPDTLSPRAPFLEFGEKQPAAALNR